MIVGFGIWDGFTAKVSSAFVETDGNQAQRGPGKAEAVDLKQEHLERWVC